MTRKHVPKYRRQHRPRGPDNGFVEVDGHRYYLGPYDSARSRERYARLLAERETSGGLLTPRDDDITVAELVAEFWQHAQTYYRRPDGTPTNELTTHVTDVVVPMTMTWLGRFSKIPSSMRWQSRFRCCISSMM